MSRSCVEVFFPPILLDNLKSEGVINFNSYSINTSLHLGMEKSKSAIERLEN